MFSIGGDEKKRRKKNWWWWVWHVNKPWLEAPDFRISLAFCRRSFSHCGLKKAIRIQKFALKNTEMVLESLSKT